MNYKDSGVDIDLGNKFTKGIASIADMSFDKNVINGIGSFNSLYSLADAIKSCHDPVLVSSTDGVGTKLKLASKLNIHNTIGIDLVAMCVNDIITCGAKPLFFLDYFATGKLNEAVGFNIIQGITTGCLMAKCALVGGETAEMPGMYSDNEYDLAGFSVGIVDRPKIIDGIAIEPGDVIIGLASSGLHSNGYSLARKALELLDLETYYNNLGDTLGNVLLKPTLIYSQYIDRLLSVKGLTIKGMVNITGGGFIDNIPRVLPDDTKANIYLNSWTIPPIFQTIQMMGNIPDDEMYRTFNMGIGYIIIADKFNANNILRILNDCGCKSYTIGTIAHGSKEVMLF